MIKMLRKTAGRTLWDRVRGGWRYRAYM
jgi:hypothetical protein